MPTRVVVVASFFGVLGVAALGMVLLAGAALVLHQRIPDDVGIKALNREIALKEGRDPDVPPGRRKVVAGMTAALALAGDTKESCPPGRERGTR